MSGGPRSLQRPGLRPEGAQLLSPVRNPGLTSPPQQQRSHRAVHTARQGAHDVPQRRHLPTPQLLLAAFWPRPPYAGSLASGGVLTLYPAGNMLRTPSVLQAFGFRATGLADMCWTGVVPGEICQRWIGRVGFPATIRCSCTFCAQLCSRVSYTRNSLRSGLRFQRRPERTRARIPCWSAVGSSWLPVRGTRLSNTFPLNSRKTDSETSWCKCLRLLARRVQIPMEDRPEWTVTQYGSPSGSVSVLE